MSTIFRTLYVSIFSFVLASVCVCTILLWHFSETSGGYEIGDRVNHYVLTYGPTTGFVLVIAFWRQVDLHVKSTMPWIQLGREHVLASQSVLLDYTSILQVSAFWKASYNGHAAVVASILGFVLLKIATLSSTGLLVVSPGLRHLETTETLQTHFTSNSLNINQSLGLSDPSIVYTTYGILAQNLQVPFGLSKGLAYSTFTVNDTVPTGANMSMLLNAFVPSFECHRADITPQPPKANDTDAFPETLVQLSSPSCKLRAQDVAIFTLNPRLFRCPNRQLSGLMQPIDCDDTAFNKSGGVYKLVVMAEMEYDQVLNSTDTGVRLSESVNPLSWSTQVARMTGLICRLSYSMATVQATVLNNETDVSVGVQSLYMMSNSTIEDFSDDDFDQLFRTSLTAADTILGSRTDNRYALEYPDPILKLMSIASNGTYEGLLDENVMQQAGGIVATQLGAQIAHQFLRTNISSRIPVRISLLQSRLKVTTLSAWIIAGSTLAVITLYLLLIWWNLGSPSCQAQTRSALMNIVRSSQTLQIELLKSQSYTESELLGALRDTHVYVTYDHVGQVEISLEADHALSQLQPKLQPWWHPFTVSLPVMVFSSILSIAIVAILELLQHISDDHNGFIAIPEGPSNYDTAYTHYIPALVALLAASMFNCLDYNVVLLSPFHRMRSLLTQHAFYSKLPTEQIPIISMWTAFRQKYWAALASSQAALVGSLLTIVVSGLYGVRTQSVMISAMVQQNDMLSAAWLNSALNDDGAALISTLTENLRFSDPRGTNGELVFPTLKLEDVDWSASNISTPRAANQSFAATLLSWRADLDCVQLSPKNFSLSLSPSRIQNTATVNATFGLPPQCLFGGSNGTEYVLEFVHTFPFSNNLNSTIVGKILDLHVGPFDPVRGGSQGEVEPSAIDDNPMGCPSIAFIYGEVNVGNASSIMVDVCYQRIQALAVDYTFLDFAMKISEVQAPIINESTVQYLLLSGNTSSSVNDVFSSSAFQYRIQDHFDASFVVFNTTNQNPFSSLGSQTQVVDNFFQGVMYGRTPIGSDLFRLASQDDAGTIRKGILAFYRRYMAQAISLNMRITRNSSNSDLFIDTSSVLIKVPNARMARRIVQDSTSKWILQGMLAFMLLCGVIAHCNINMQKLLPACANPCTIWGQMSLWAGSEACALIPEARHPSRIQDTKVVERNLNIASESVLGYRLGWWDLPDGTRRYGADHVT